MVKPPSQSNANFYAGLPPSMGGRYCSRCGHWLQPGQESCPNCARRGAKAGLTREWVLTAVLALLFPGIVITGIMTQRYHAKEKDFAAEWFHRGNNDIQAGNYSGAVTALQTSLIYSPDNAPAQLLLAQALIPLRHYNEAQTYLESVLSADPGNGPANLQLARIAVSRGEHSEAIRYYHNAFYGEWPDYALPQRLAARLEFSEYLLAHHDAADVTASLISLSAATPPSNSALHLKIGQLFLQNGDAPRSLEEFRTVLRASRENSDALVGAGTASIQIGAFRQAADYFADAKKISPEDPAAKSGLAAANNALAADPFLPGLSSEAAEERARAAFGAATDRLRACQSALQQSPQNSDAVAELKSLDDRAQSEDQTFTARRRKSNQVDIYRAMDLVFDIEKATAKHCESATGLNQILLEMAGAPRGETQ